MPVHWIVDGHLHLRRRSSIAESLLCVFRDEDLTDDDSELENGDGEDSSSDKGKAPAVLSDSDRYAICSKSF